MTINDATTGEAIEDAAASRAARIAGLDVRRDSDGHLLVDRSGRTTIAGLYGAGDAAAPGPQQLIVAAGQGARAAAVMVHDMVGVRTTH